MSHIGYILYTNSDIEYKLDISYPVFHILCMYFLKFRYILHQMSYKVYDI